jgi:hypothetical protein
MSNGELLIEPDSHDIGRAVTDMATAFEARMQQAIDRQSAIIALRGAGSTGGIDPEAAAHVLDDLLIPRVEEDLRRGPVAIIYDGDPDNREKPDIGSVAGGLRDYFDDRRGDQGVSFLTAQRRDWYYPTTPGSNLTNANGLPYETFVFPEGVYEGDHNSFTQSKLLARYRRYRQVYVSGGPIATEQLGDYANKVPAGSPMNVVVVRALINRALSAEIGDKLAQATTDAQRQKFEAMLEQRRKIYGQQWNNDGEFDESILEEMQQETDTHKLVALWEDQDTVKIVNCEKIDLHSQEMDALFQEANYFVKTRPITARQVPQGQSEIVIVRSGATKDTANGEDWVCTKTDAKGVKEDYVVYKDEFHDIWEHVEGTDNTFAPRYNPRKLVKVTRDVIFVPAWGGQQAIEAGGFLQERVIETGPRAGQKERYGVAQKDVEGDFVPA